MNHNKKAFSVVEVLVVLCFVGFIIITQLVILSSKINQYSAPFYTAYNAIKKTAYNILADIYCPGDACPDPSLTAPRAYPQNSTNLCRRFAEFINTSENNCDTMSAITDTNMDFENATPGFIASNSLRFYFHQTDTPFQTIVPAGAGGNETINYFIIYIDLNGEKKPNRIGCDGSDILPDIVPFAITSRGDAIPIGLPVYSKTYMTATVGLPANITTKKDDAGNDVTTAEELQKTKALSFYDAILTAWKGVEHASIPYSINFMNRIDSNITDHFKGCCLVNTTGCKGTGITGTSNDTGCTCCTGARIANAVTNSCAGGTYNCRVTIDKHKTSRY